MTPKRKWFTYTLNLPIQQILHLGDDKTKESTDIGNVLIQLNSIFKMEV
jgi:hypothetical protein